ncbi:MAG: geranylgeranylglyceryl/heptaprenylglyceryl phosphate synthase [Bacteroidota bacterium]
MNSLLNQIGRKKELAVLIDPDNHDLKSVQKFSAVIQEHQVDYILLGGSLVSSPMDDFIESIKEITNIPVILFPGSLLQLSSKADGILLLSLISGRNPDYLIGNQVVAAPVLKKMKLEIIPTGYILVQNGYMSSAEYMSNTKPIPKNKPELATATAIAGEMLGQKLIYLEGGSGATRPISSQFIVNIKSNISIPLIVGGGIKKPEQISELYQSGADLIVIGNLLEKYPAKLKELIHIRNIFNNQS